MFGILKSLLKFIGILVLAGVVVTAYLLVRGGALKSIEPSFDGECETLALNGSAEDILVDRDRGFAYLSLIDRQKLVEGSGDDVQGTIARVDLNKRPLSIADAIKVPLDHFRPHGMSLYVDENGQRYLFVINHPTNRGKEPERVELFREDTPGIFAHLKTYRSDLINAPNDLVAVGPRQFYVANDAVADGGWKAGAQQFGVGYSTIVYVDEDVESIVADDIASGGGINVSGDARTLYVAETLGKRVRLLNRNPVTGGLSELGRVGIGTSPDNIDVAADGSLWIGAHANTLKLIQHFISGSPAPSQVIRVKLTGSAKGTVDEIFLDTGEKISASSVGATYRNQLLIGSITDRKMLVCKMQEEA